MSAGRSWWYSGRGTRLSGAPVTTANSQSSREKSVDSLSAGRAGGARRSRRWRVRGGVPAVSGGQDGRDRAVRSGRVGLLGSRRGVARDGAAGRRPGGAWRRGGGVDGVAAVTAWRCAVLAGQAAGAAGPRSPYAFAPGLCRSTGAQEQRGQRAAHAGVDVQELHRARGGSSTTRWNSTPGRPRTSRRPPFPGSAHRSPTAMASRCPCRTRTAATATPVDADDSVRRRARGPSRPGRYAEVGPAENRCKAAGTYYVVVERNRRPRIRTEAMGPGTPRRLGARCGQGDATTPPESWNSASPTPPAGERRERRGGAGYNERPGLGGRLGRPDQARPDTFYRVPVDWGQQISASAELGSASGGNSDGVLRAVGLVMSLSNPVRARVDDADTAYDGKQNPPRWTPAPGRVREPLLAGRRRGGERGSPAGTTSSVHLSPRSPGVRQRAAGPDAAGECRRRGEDRARVRGVGAARGRVRRHGSGRGAAERG